MKTMFNNFIFTVHVCSIILQYLLDCFNYIYIFPNKYRNAKSTETIHYILDFFLFLYKICLIEIGDV